MPLAGHPEIRVNAWSAATTTDARPSTLDSFTKENTKKVMVIMEFNELSNKAMDYQRKS